MELNLTPDFAQPPKAYTASPSATARTWCVGLSMLLLAGLWYEMRPHPTSAGSDKWAQASASPTRTAHHAGDAARAAGLGAPERK